MNGSQRQSHSKTSNTWKTTWTIRGRARCSVIGKREEDTYRISLLILLFIVDIVIIFIVAMVALCCARWCQFKNRSLYRVHEKMSIARHRRLHGRHYGDTTMGRSNVCRWNTTVRRTMARALVMFLNKRFVRLPRTSKAEEESAELARHNRVESGAYYHNADRAETIQPVHSARPVINANFNSLPFLQNRYYRFIVYPSHLFISSIKLSGDLRSSGGGPRNDSTCNPKKPLSDRYDKVH